MEDVLFWGANFQSRGTYSGVAWVILMCSTVTLDRFRIIVTIVSMMAVLCLRNDTRGSIERRQMFYLGKYVNCNRYIG